MDWHKLQHTLYNLDPTDPREDLAKLRAAAQTAAADVALTKDYITESVEVPQGSLGLDRDYSVADFAALAGVRLDEKQKMGSAGQAKGRDPMPKTSKPSSTGEQPHPLKDKLVGEEGAADAFKHGLSNYNKPGAITGAAGRVSPNEPKQKAGGATQQTQKTQGTVTGAQLAKQIGVSDPNAFLQAIQKVRQGQPINRIHQAAFSDAFQKLMAMDPENTQRVMMMLKRMEARETTEAKKPETPKQRNPVATYAQRSGAGVHKDQNKKNQLPRKEKHKSKVPMESIKEMLYRKLAEKK